MKDENGSDCSYSMENILDPSVGSHELFNVHVESESYENNMPASSTQTLTLSSEGNISDDAKTQNKLKKTHKRKTKPKDNAITNANNALAFELINSSTSDDSTFLAKAILACILIAFFAACTLPLHKNANVITLYGKGLVQIWNRLGNIT